MDGVQQVNAPIGCGFFNKTRRSSCPHSPVITIIRPDGHETDACNGHAAAFFLHWNKRNPGQFWTGQIVRIVK